MADFTVPTLRVGSASFVEDVACLLLSILKHADGFIQQFIPASILDDRKQITSLCLSFLSSVHGNQGYLEKRLFLACGSWHHAWWLEDVNIGAHSLTPWLSPVLSPVSVCVSNLRSVL